MYSCLMLIDVSIYSTHLHSILVSHVTPVQNAAQTKAREEDCFNLKKKKNYQKLLTSKASSEQNISHTKLNVILTR